MTPEDQLIVLLARKTLTRCARDEALTLLATPLQWHLVVARLIEEEVYPLFHQNLDLLAFSGVPELVRSQTLGLWKTNALNSFLMTEEVEYVLRLLAGASIPVIPLKGVTLAESLYGDVYARVSGDIDVLIPPWLVDRAFGVLLADGFEDCDRYDRQIQAGDIDALLDSNIEHSFLHRTRAGTFLHELHWDIAWRWPRNQAAIDDLWADAGRRTYWETGGYSLGPDWNLLYLAVHVSRHQWQGLKWLVDIHELSLSSQVDWASVKAKASRFGWERMLTLTLNVCHVVLGTPIPEGFRSTSLSRRLEIFPARRGAASPWMNVFFPARLFNWPFDKLLYLARVTFLPTLVERRLIRLPSFLQFLYCVVRPLRLAYLLGSRLIRGSYEGYSRDAKG